MWDGSLLADLAETEPACRYLIVVAASEEPLYRYLRARFEGDAGTRVILDRRRRADLPDGFTDLPGGERRLSRTTHILASGVAVIRLTDGRPTKRTTLNEPAGKRGRATMEGIEGLEDRQRVDRWLEESQYLIGRMLPAYLDDRERVRARLEAVEQDNERLKIELADARREITELRGDVDFHRAERARFADNFHTMVEHLAALQRPINDISSRLQATQPASTEARV
jgi:hypothetical protein